MKIKKQTIILASVISLVLIGLYFTLAPRSSPVNPAGSAGTNASQGASISSTGLVTMIDLGATECIPCKMMAPILEEVRKEYDGRAEIIFIDVWKNPEQAKKYGIRAIPTQIFYDAAGREMQRHEGFLDKKKIVEILTRLGAT